LRYTELPGCIVHERRWRDRAGGAGCGPRGPCAVGPPRPARRAQRGVRASGWRSRAAGAAPCDRPRPPHATTVH